MTLKIKVKHPFACPLLSPVANMIQTRSWDRFWHFRCRGYQKCWTKLRDLNGWPWKSRSKHSLYDLSYLRLYTGCRLDLGVGSNIYNVEDLKNLQISHLTLMIDLENEGQTHMYMTFRISGCKHHTNIIFVSILTFGGLNFENVEIIYVSKTFDLGTQGYTHFCYDLSYLRLYACYWPRSWCRF